MSFILKDTHITVTCCGDCPNNIAWPNPIIGLIPSKNQHPPWVEKIFPPSHRCSVAIDTITWDTAGRLIFDPNRIPAWCPHES